ncbi:MAG: hypothetical protein E3J72_14845 [Planctomycetota bacterium]|nr:MAG: hypothetical protein E3J72_14845 [Planctomycetota bacterium]
MNEIWEKNKRFILMAVGGLVVVLFGWNNAQSSISDSASRTERAHEEIYSSMDQISESFLLREQRADQEAKLLLKDERLAERLESLIAPEPRKALPDDNPAAQLQGMITTAQTVIVQKGFSHGTKVLAKDWGISSLVNARATPEDLKTLQIRLEMTQRLLDLAIVEARVKEIEKVRQLSPVRLAVPRSEGEKDIELLPIEVTCYGDAKSLARFAFEIVRKRDDGIHNFFYLKDAEISAGRRRSTTPRRNPRGGLARTAVTDEKYSRSGTFVCCALRIVKAERKSARKTRTRGRSRGGRRYNRGR